MKCSGILISALRGGSGKTIVSVGVAAALRAQGRSVAPFKKGPDYIDAGWLSMAAGRPCYNLDTYLVDTPQILQSYNRRTHPDDMVVVEANRGLYDSIDTEGRTSSAELAKLLALPVIMVLDATKTTRTMAAVVGGCCQFDDQVNICGVILNRVAGKRHESILRRSIEQFCDIPVIGAIPKLRKEVFPERHMGLVPTQEHSWAADSIAMAAKIARDHIDLDRLQDLARQAGKVTVPASEGIPKPPAGIDSPPTIGILRDSAFQFYYPENIDALTEAGAKVVFCSPLQSLPMPAVDALYIGGGFPETHAEQLAANQGFRENMRQLAQNGLPIYAECGGLMYLGRTLALNEGVYPMANILPVAFGFSKRPQGHGYTHVHVDRENPYYPVGTTFRGHEFHYSTVQSWEPGESRLVFEMQRGNGIQNGRDGLCYRNVLATYSHIHALGLPIWARSMVRNAVAFREQQAIRPAI